MRVVGGQLRGRKLLAPDPRWPVKPTADRTREAIFDLLGPGLSGEAALDLFAGTGALGIEALSRGFQTAVFVEQDRKVLSLVQKNLELCRLGERARVACREVLSFLRRDASSPGPFDLVLLDPPYGKGLVTPVLKLLVAPGWLGPGARVVAEAEARFVFPEEVGILVRHKERRYGAAQVAIYQAV